MDGPEIVARTLSVPSIADKFGHTWQYHPRSDYHSKVACWAIMFDLLRSSGVLDRHVRDNKVIFGLNHEMRDFKSGRKKDLDLVVARPGSGSGTGSVRTFVEMGDELRVVLTPSERAALGALSQLVVGPVGTVLLALEAKACMTKHVGAKPRLHDELNSSHLAIHGSSDQAIAAGFVMINASTTFISPDRNRHDLRTHDVVVTPHRQPAAVEGIEEKVREIPRRTRPGEEGFDALGIVVVDCKNDGSPVQLVTAPPAPATADIFHYDQMIRRVAHVYDTLFASI